MFPFDDVIMWCNWTKQSTASIFRKLQRIAFTGDVNFALNRPANQSTTRLDNVAGYAVDGITDNDDLCTHTATGDIHPWWKVQLAFPINVTHVEIMNRIVYGEWCVNIGNRYLLRWKLCRACWHTRSSLWQPILPRVATKMASKQLCFFTGIILFCLEM